MMVERHPTLNYNELEKAIHELGCKIVCDALPSEGASLEIIRRVGIELDSLNEQKKRQTLYLWPIHNKYPPCKFSHLELATPDGKIIRIPSYVTKVEAIEETLKELGLDIDVKVFPRTPALDYKEEKTAELQEKINKLQKELDEVEKLEVE